MNFKKIVLPILLIIFVVVVIVGYNRFYTLDDETKQKIKEEQIEREKRNTKEQALKEKIENLKYPLLVFTFDDGASSDYETVYPMFREKGIKGTSFVVGNWINKDGFMNIEQIKEMLNGGWDIQGHTLEHKRLKEIKSDEVVEQVIKNNERFKELGLPEPKHLALPYGQINEKDRGLVAEHRNTIRNVSSTSSGRTNNWESIDFTNLSSVNIDTTDVDRIKEDIDFAIETNSIIILFGHRIGEDDYQTPLNTLKEITDYIIEKNIETVTISEMYDRVIDFQDKVKQ